MQWADEVQIETPEQLDLGMELAGLGSRFVAKVVDWVVKFVVFVLLPGITIWLLAATGADHVIPGNSELLAKIFLVAWIFGTWIGSDILLELRNGQTVGKRFAGIRVIRESGAPVDLRSVFIRNFLALVDWLPAFYFLGNIIILLSARSQRLGDLAAGTIVVRERATELPDQDATALGFLVSDEFQFTADHLRNCTANDRHILRSFFRRYAEMNEDARHQLACRLAEQFLEKIPYQPDPPIWPYPRAERFLASLYRDLMAHALPG